jgi:hypothetical protein
LGAKEREEDGDDSYIVFVRDRLKENLKKIKKLVSFTINSNSLSKFSMSGEKFEKGKMDFGHLVIILNVQYV